MEEKESGRNVNTWFQKFYGNQAHFSVEVYSIKQIKDRRSKKIALLQKKNETRSKHCESPNKTEYRYPKI